MFTKLRPSLAQKPLRVLSEILSVVAMERRCWANCSHGGAISSPMSTQATMMSAPAFITQETVFDSDTPAARMTVISLVLTSAPSANRLPRRAATGNRS